MRSSIYFLLFASIFSSLLFIGCKESSYDIEMLAHDPETDSIVYKVNTVETLTDLHRLEGRATTVLGGLSIELDYQLQEVRWNEVGSSVAFNALKAGDVYYPEDYSSLAMISVYYGIERAMLFFESVGMEKNRLENLETYYFAEVISIDELGQIEDEAAANNAFYMPIDENDRGFYILPFTIDVGVPLSMNPGVLTHEYTHAVFQELILDNLTNGLAAGQVNDNYLYGLNEGLADVFAVALTGDPDYIRPSISDIQVTRNAAEIIEYKAVYDMDAESLGPLQFNPYVIGAFVSATLYEMERRFQGLPSNSTGIPGLAMRQEVATAAFSSMKALGDYGAEYFVLTDFFNQLLSQFSAARQPVACQVLAERYAIHYSELEVCH
ncbi:MAG: hypothetical protein JXX29_00925 [Deltaproteobacteria bacterium]|nr:hypothetical protein [Deltaproteobacteria bacterium]MBN2670201.1 hypothetical protein [Deltaproteobacteria bacterium]